MIVQQLPDGRTLCINQTSHALMAAAFCRHWGNEAFAAPTPYEPVMMAIAQHDNGWYEWEEAPLLRPDGFPMDFMHGPAADAKVALWELGIARAAAQHPYAGLLVRRHATLLYASALERLDEGRRTRRRPGLCCALARGAGRGAGPAWRPAWRPAHAH